MYARRLAALTSLIVAITAPSLRAADKIADRFVAKVISEQLDVGGNNRHLVILQAARELGMFDAALADTAAKVDESRADKQPTGSSSTAGSVAKADKPGIAELLAIALERGAISKSKQGTNVTLSTTPYLLLTAFGNNDTPENWESLAWARRISVASTFSSEAVTEGDFSTFLSGELKLALGGNRTGRDAALMLASADDIVVANLAGLRRCEPFLATPSGRVLETQALAFDASLQQNAAAGGSSAERLATAVDTTALNMDTATRSAFTVCVESILAAYKGIAADADLVKALTEKYLAKNKRNQFSTAVLFQRDPATSDYSTVKLIYARELTATKISLNGEISFNQRNQTKAGIDLDRIRGYSVESALNSGKMAGGRTDASIAVKWYDKKDNKGYILSGQALLNVHLSPTMKLPIALSYANRTLADANAKKGLQFEFGVAALLDKLLGSARGQ